MPIYVSSVDTPLGHVPDSYQTFQSVTKLVSAPPADKNRIIVTAAVPQNRAYHKSARFLGSPRREHAIAFLSIDPSLSPRQSSTNSKPIMPMNCSIFGFASGFVIKSAGFMFVPTFLVVSRKDLEASCIYRLCMSTCLALPSPSAIDQAHRCCGIQM